MKTSYQLLSLSLLLLFNVQLSTAQLASDIDTTFGTSGYRITDFAGNDEWVYSLALQSDGKIIAAGITNSGDIIVARYSSTGTLDNTFGTSGYQIILATTVSVDDADVVIQPDGKIVVGARYRNGTNLDFCLVRLNTNGTLDNTFGTGGIQTTDVGGNLDKARSIAIQPDGKIILAGEVGTGTTANFAIARYTTNGSLDNTFGTNGIQINNIVAGRNGIESVVLQADGKIIAAGYANNGADDDYVVVRYNSDGTFDNTFGTAGIATVDYNNKSNSCHAVALQTDGKIVVTGTHSAASTYDFMTIRLNTDGTLDNTFGTGGILVTNLGGDEKAWDLVIQSSGKIIIVGEEDDFVSLTRYDANGALDNSFGTGGNQTTNVPGNYDKGRAVVIQPNGKILVSGNTYNTNNDFLLVRYYGDALTTVIKENQEKELISLYPNPTTSAVNIELAKIHDEIKVVIMNSMGQLIDEKEYQKVSNINLTINGNTGIYFVKVLTEENQLVTFPVLKN
jgi:uncharacterized delta-60 repeat protein